MYGQRFNRPGMPVQGPQPMGVKPTMGQGMNEMGNTGIVPPMAQPTMPAAGPVVPPPMQGAQRMPMRPPLPGAGGFAGPIGLPPRPGVPTMGMGMNEMGPQYGGDQQRNGGVDAGELGGNWADRFKS